MLLFENFTVFILSHPLIPVSHVLSILMEPCLDFVDASTCTSSHLKVSKFPGTNSLSQERWCVTWRGQKLHAHCAGLNGRRGQSQRRMEMKYKHPSTVTCFQFEHFSWTP